MATMDSILTLLQEDYTVGSVRDFHAHQKQMLMTAPKPGYYKFPPRVGDKHLIHRLQIGAETPIRLSFTNQIRTPEQLAARMATVLMLDTVDVLERLTDNTYMAQYGLDKYSAICLFIPNTYEVYWTYSADQLFARMAQEYKRFWNEERLHKADSLGLTPVEVATLASIVEGETHNAKEYGIIASLYLNRIRKGMHLQACPTVIYASGNFKLRRVLKRHLAIDSPYNTYKYVGLPPGPIRCPNGSTIDAVLNAPKTNYLYMCANPDFSGTHIFSSSYADHQRAAVQYRQELNERDIR